MYDQIAADAVRQIREERAELTRLRAEIEARIEEAFKEGFISVQTYNDTRLNSPDEAWEENKRSLLRGTTVDAAKGGAA